ncbi:acetylornithine deacetylase [Chelatococcus asaccharovorans]|uniref:Acetylornithine deacetylase n=1 Tax=Chelatococcus asaccharovorans TaxID=28210 RepID=A0A2V3TXY2_9HYPH|nr:acetylornithine deacetylase [Chelatococcus asaccharovorans]MBS7706800.1 acetylornithine deacetylase [Chelatococcus asaccharovorans]PXW54054.1 acetylornithine deacetylase [Chelatococcus asaccharovorans]
MSAPPAAPLSAKAALARLIAFPTVSAASNLDLLDWVETTLAPLGARFRRFPSPDGTKANLFASIGPDAPGGLVLSGHTDVVPTAGQDWSGDPFVMREDNGRLIGRGATDMKGFLACCIAAAQSVATLPLVKPLHLAFSYDEEVGCTGVWPMAEWLGGSGLSPQLAVIGEPSSLQVIDAHKGGLIGWTTVTGKPGHSSQPDRYVNAVMVAGELIAFINGLRREFAAGGRHEGLDPPYSTIQVNIINGGLHGNIVAESCRFFWEMRVIPGVDAHDVLARIEDFARVTLEPAMKAIDPGCGIAFEVQAHIPPLAPNADRGAETMLMDLVGQTTPLKVPYGTEAGIFQRFGTPAVVCGPGDIAQAHQPDEFIEEAELEHCVALITRLAEERLCSVT